MFRIPAYNLMSKMTFEEAEKIIKRLAVNNTLLDGLEYVSDLWDNHCSAADSVDDDDFFDNWIYEVNAFNIIYKRMQPLFA